VTRIGIDERRRRVAVRHHLAPTMQLASVATVARDLVCLHATDPATVYLSAWARTSGFTVETLDRALYQDRQLVRMLAMRRTMFVVPADEVETYHAGASAAIAVTERKRTEALAALAGIDEPAQWLAAAETATLAALTHRGEAIAQELSADVPELRLKARVNIGKAYEGDIGMSSRVLLLLGLDGQVVRARPRGSWVSSQYRWAPLATWLGRPLGELTPTVAQAAIARCWLARFGPGTEADLRWWTGWTLGATRAALAGAGAIEVDLDGARGYVLAGDTEPTPPVQPWVALLPSLDPTTMGWQARGWYLGAHKDRLFDTNGNAGPTIWVDGRIVGGWGARAKGEVVTRLLEDVGGEAARSIEAQAARLTEWLRSTRVVPRFPTPLHRELVG
jgi:hypothetical protein